MRLSTEKSINWLDNLCKLGARFRDHKIEIHKHRHIYALSLSAVPRKSGRQAEWHKYNTTMVRTIKIHWNQIQTRGNTQRAPTQYTHSVLGDSLPFQRILFATEDNAPEEHCTYIDSGTHSPGKLHHLSRWNAIHHRTTTTKHLEQRHRRHLR